MNQTETDARFVLIADADALAAWLPPDGLALLYLDDPYCPICRRAKREMSRLDEEIALLDVHAHPELADVVEELTGIRHESPQTIVLRDGAPIWSASHYAIRADAVLRAMERTTTAE
ncbi:MAG: DUF2847 family protein [Thermomicrobiales bacterium]|nr:DUF2847 family protein [Thermomicrobiales bacterium]